MNEFKCAICGSDFAEEFIVRCSKCELTHCNECWKLVENCGTYGCDGNQSVALTKDKTNETNKLPAKYNFSSKAWIVLKDKTMRFLGYFFGVNYYTLEAQKKYLNVTNDNEILYLFGATLTFDFGVVFLWFSCFTNYPPDVSVFVSFVFGSLITLFRYFSTLTLTMYYYEIKSEPYKRESILPIWQLPFFILLLVFYHFPKYIANSTVSFGNHIYNRITSYIDTEGERLLDETNEEQKTRLLEEGRR